MHSLPHLFTNNRAWARSMVERDPDFFSHLSSQQAPEYLWIGCADSRVPANQIIGLEPGEIFVHRNVANLVVHSDLNCLSVIQYAVDVLKVKHIIVCGHYGCGGVLAAMANTRAGLVDNWLGHIRDLYHQHRARMEALTPQQRADKLCELNVVQQVANVCNTTIVDSVWAEGRELTVHGWIYNLQDGLLRDLGLEVATLTDPREACLHTVNRLLTQPVV